MAQKLRKYYLDTEENREYLRELGEELLAFGQRFPSPGGSSWYLGDDGTPWKDRPRETWITSRMTHVYSIGTMLAADAGEKERFAALADAGLKGLRGELRDKENGGWYAGLAPDGTPLSGSDLKAQGVQAASLAEAVTGRRWGAWMALDLACLPAVLEITGPLGDFDPDASSVQDALSLAVGAAACIERVSLLKFPALKFPASAFRRSFSVLTRPRLSL